MLVSDVSAEIGRVPERHPAFLADVGLGLDGRMGAQVAGQVGAQRECFRAVGAVEVFAGGVDGEFVAA